MDSRLASRGAVWRKGAYKPKSCPIPPPRRWPRRYTGRVLEWSARRGYRSLSPRPDDGPRPPRFRARRARDRGATPGACQAPSDPVPATRTRPSTPTRQSTPPARPPRREKGSTRASPLHRIEGCGTPRDRARDWSRAKGRDGKGRSIQTPRPRPKTGSPQPEARRRTESSASRSSPRAPPS